jgi:hypothetical protein
VNATALALALALSTPPPAVRPVPPPPPDVPPTDREPAPAATRAPDVPGNERAPIPPARARRFLLGAAALVDSSVLPQAAIGPSLSVGYRVSLVDLELGAAFLPDQHVTLSDRGTAKLHLLTAQARGCYRFFAIGFSSASLLGLFPCATFDVGSLSASASGPETTSASSLWVAPGLAVRARWPATSDFGAFIDAGSAYALWRPEFVLDGVRHIHQASPFTGRLGFGLQVQL